jgi:hypothetical protein
MIKIFFNNKIKDLEVNKDKNKNKNKNIIVLKAMAYVPSFICAIAIIELSQAIGIVDHAISYMKDPVNNIGEQEQIFYLHEYFKSFNNIVRDQCSQANVNIFNNYNRKPMSYRYTEEYR